MKFTRCGLSGLFVAIFLMGCSVAPSDASANGACNWVSVDAFSEDPRPWAGKEICTEGALFRNEDDHNYFHLKMPNQEPLPDGVIVFLDSFKDTSTESSLRSANQGIKIKISATLSIFEDCWDAEDNGETDDPCLPARKPIFLDEIELLSSIE